MKEVMQAVMTKLLTFVLAVVAIFSAMSSALLLRIFSSCTNTSQVIVSDITLH